MVSITEVPLTRHYDSKFVPRHVLRSSSSSSSSSSSLNGGSWDRRYQKGGTFLSKDLTLCILPEEPHVLQVAVTAAATAASGVFVVELDLQEVLSTGLVAVHGSVLPNNNDGVELSCMDVYGSLLQCQFHVVDEKKNDKNEGVVAVAVVGIDDVVVSSCKVSCFPTRNNVRISCASYYEGTVWLVGQSPHLYAWDVVSNKIVSWTSDKCYFPSSSQKNWKQVLEEAAGLWVGQTNWNTLNNNNNNDNNKVSIDNEQEEAIPIAALTVIRTNNHSSRALGVISLDANANLKLWTSPSEETCDLVSTNPWMFPERCRTLPLDLPASTDWSPEWDAISMTSFAKEPTSFTLALCIRTAWNTTSQHPDSHVLCYHGVLEALPKHTYPSELSYTLPISSHTLRGWTYDPTTHILHILWSSSTNNNQTTELSLEQYTLRSNGTFQLVTHTNHCHWLPSTTHSKQDTSILANHYYHPNNNNNNDTTTTLEEELEQMNKWYMKLLFVSSSPPSFNCVHLALTLLFPSYFHHSKTSLEYDTLMTMRAASYSTTTTTTTVVSPKHSQPKQSDTTPTNTTTTVDASIYYRLKHATTTSTSPTKKTPASPMAADNNNDNSKMILLQAQQTRWQQLIEKVWELERTYLHAPLGLYTENNKLNLIRVGGSNSLVLVPTPPPSNTIELTTEEQIHSKLDHLAWTIYQETSSASLVQFEQDVYKWISSGNCQYDSSLQTLCATLGNETCSHLFTTATIMDTLVPLWTSLLSSSSWITNYSHPNDNNGLYNMVLQNIQPTPSKKKEQLVKASSVVTRICIEQIRQMALARCLFVGALSLRLPSTTSLGVDNENRWMDTWSAYLKVVSIQWCNSQTYYSHNYKSQRSSSLTRQNKIPPKHAFSPIRKEPQPEEQPELQRPRLTKDTPNHMQIHPTMLEVRLMELANKNDNSTVVSLTNDFLKLAFSTTTPQTTTTTTTTTTTSVHKNLSELAILPHGLKHPLRYSLRLLAPSLAYPPTTVTNTAARKEMVAECFLEEAKFAPSKEQVVELYRRASDLLKENAPDVFVDVDLSIAWKALQQVPDGWTIPHRLSDDYYNNSLLDFFQHILPDVKKDSWTKLLSMQTVRSLFLPWIVTAGNANIDPLSLILNNALPHIDDDHENVIMETDDNDGQKIDANSVEESIRQLLSVFLQICSFLHRVAILERHSTSSSTLLNSTSPTNAHHHRLPNNHNSTYDDRSKTILDAIHEVIDLMELYLPVTDTAVEYGTLYSSAFRHAILCHEWEQALDACLSSKTQQQQQQFRRLVISMVDAGQFGKFLQLLPLSSISTKSSSSLDIYELAVDTLVEASLEQSSRSNDNHNHYRGCLYALHASCGNWRRATQAIDLYGIVALSSNAEQDIMINDLSLAALASSHTIQLVPNPNHRFIVSGEVGPYPLPHCFRDTTTAMTNMDEDESLSNNKRKNRASDSTILFATPSSVGNNQQSSDGVDRLSRLLTQESLKNRAMKLLVMNTLAKDSMCCPSSLLLKSSDKEAIDNLAKLGYYSQAMILATYCNSTGRRQRGRDRVADAMSYITSKYIAPITTAAQSNNDHDLVMEEGSNITASRPTLAQLEQQLPSPIGPMIYDSSWMTLSLSEQTRKGKVAMKLLEHFVTKHSTVDNSLAIEIAGRLLDLEYGKAKLPLWMTNLLLTGTNTGTTTNDGLFASKQVRDNVADPASLLSLYMKRGLYVEACDVVSTTLLGNHRRRQEASCRLPEKGNIDYVPYPTIDILWHLIQEQIDSGNDNDGTLLQARNRMEQSLKEHFELMKISEQGMHSARVLK